MPRIQVNRSDSPSLHYLLTRFLTRLTQSRSQKTFWELTFLQISDVFNHFFYVATSLFFWFDYILWKCCFALVQFRHIKHLVRVSEKSCFHFSLNIWMCGQKTWPEMTKISILLCYLWNIQLCYTWIKCRLKLCPDFSPPSSRPPPDIKLK